MRKNWHPKSWSQQARELGDIFFYNWENKEEAIATLKNSYRAPIIRYRAIKRFARKLKKEGSK